MTKPELPIETERLMLRPFRKSDLEDVAAYLALPDVQRYLDWKARDKEEAKSALEAMMREQRMHRPGDAISLAIIRKGDNKLIGHISLRWVDATAGQAEIRFIVSPDARRNGYAREAARAVLDLGFEELGMHRVFARCSARNEPSAKLLRHLGMRLEAHYREHALFQGEWDEELHFAVLDREWVRGSKVKELSRHKVA